MEPVNQGQLFPPGPDHTTLVDLSVKEGEDAGAVLYYQTVVSPFGPLLVAESTHGLAWLGVGDDAATGDALGPLRKDRPAATLEPRQAPLGRQVTTYFRDGCPPPAPWPTDLRATPFQRTVWRELLTVPRRRTLTYGELARRIGQPGATQAVGTAVGRNPLTFLVPCHRVVGGGGRAGGYRWGTEMKRRILAWE